MEIVGDAAQIRAVRVQDVQIHLPVLHAGEDEAGVGRRPIRPLERVEIGNVLEDHST